MQIPFSCEVTVTNQKGVQELQEWDAQPMGDNLFGQMFPQKCMQIKKIGPRGWAHCRCTMQPECIPVECVLSTAVAILGDVCLEGCLPRGVYTPLWNHKQTSPL